MLAVFKCESCDHNLEEYFGLFSQAPSQIDCPKCGKKMNKGFGLPHIRGFSVVSGYEKEHEDRMTLGKAVDFKQKWV